MVFQQPVDRFLRRIERAESWVVRAQNELERKPPDYDAAFVFFWIAFNAAYAHETLDSPRISTKERYAQFFSKLLRLDRKGEIRAAILSNRSEIFEHLIDNQYIYLPFWRAEAEPSARINWSDGFKQSKADFVDALGKENTEGTQTALSILFERLYDLRNQLMHGGARHRSGNNRRQVEPGAKMMALFVPILVKLMKANPAKKGIWGKLDYPPIHDKDEPPYRTPSP